MRRERVRWRRQPGALHQSSEREQAKAAASAGEHLSASEQGRMHELREDLFHHVSVNVREPEIAALEFER